MRALFPAMLAITLGAACEPTAEECTTAAINGGIDFDQLSRCEAYPQDIWIDVRNRPVMEFPNLTTAQNITLYTGDSPVEVSFPALQFSNNISVDDSTGLVSFSAPSLLESGSIGFHEHDDLDALDLSSLEVIDGEFHMESGTLPTVQRFPSLLSAQSIHIEARLVTTIDLPVLDEVVTPGDINYGQVHFTGEQLLSVTMPSLASDLDNAVFGSLVENIDIGDVAGEPEILWPAAITPTKLTLSGGGSAKPSIHMQGGAAREISIPDVMALGTLHMGAYANLETLDMGNLQTIDDLTGLPGGADPCFDEQLKRAAFEGGDFEYRFWEDDLGCFQ